MKLNELRQIIREEAKKALNEGPLVDTIQPFYTGALGKAVKALENHLMAKGKNIDWDWDKLADLIIDIVDEAKQEGYDELG